MEAALVAVGAACAAWAERMVAAGSGVGVVAADEQATKNIEPIAINRRAFNPIIGYLSDRVKDFRSRNMCRYMCNEKSILYTM